MSTHWYSVLVQPTHIVAQEIECDVVAELLDAGHPVFLGDRAELQRLAIRHGKSLRVRNSSRASRTQKREPSQSSVSDVTPGFEGAACSLFAASAVAW
jgi:hypothetical protein